MAQGYEIRFFTDLAWDPERDPKLHALHMEVRRDIPSDEPWTDLDFEEWIKGLKHPHFYGDGCFVAIKADEWAGISSMRPSDEEGVLNTGVTAIKRAHRGIGLAKALLDLLRAGAGGRVTKHETHLPASIGRRWVFAWEQRQAWTRANSLLISSRMRN